MAAAARATRVPWLACLVLLLASAAVVEPLRAEPPCDDVLTDEDLDLLLPALFDARAAPCGGTDVNDDGRIDVADVTALVQRLRQVHLGPRLTFLGITSADGRPAPPLGRLANGTAVYYRGAGFGFQVVIEAAPGPSGVPVATRVFNHSRTDPARRPDLFVQVNRDLGTPSPAVCDEDFGVPGVDPPSFALTQPISNAVLSYVEGRRRADWRDTIPAGRGGSSASRPPTGRERVNPREGETPSSRLAGHEPGRGGSSASRPPTGRAAITARDRARR